MVFLYISLYLALLFGPDLCLQRSEEMGCQWLPKLPLKDKFIASPFHLKYVYVYTLIYENHTYIYIYLIYIYIIYIYILYISYYIYIICIYIYILYVYIIYIYIYYIFNIYMYILYLIYLIPQSFHVYPKIMIDICRQGFMVQAPSAATTTTLARTGYHCTPRAT